MSREQKRPDRVIRVGGRDFTLYKTIDKLISLLLCTAMLIAFIPADLLPGIIALADEETVVGPYAGITPLSDDLRIETIVTEVDGLPVVTVEYDYSLRSPTLMNTSSGSPIVFNLSLSEPLTYAVSVDYRTLEGSAKAGVQYTAAGGTVTFAPGETNKAIQINTLTNAFDSNSIETRWSSVKSFIVQFHNPVDAQLGSIEYPNTYSSDFVTQNNGYSINFRIVFLKNYDEYANKLGYFFDYNAASSLDDPMARYRTRFFDSYAAYYRRDFSLTDDAEVPGNRDPGFGKESEPFQRALNDSNASGVSIGLEVYPGATPIDAPGLYNGYLTGKVTTYINDNGSNELYNTAVSSGLYDNWPTEYLDNTFSVWLGGHENAFFMNERGSFTAALGGGKRAIVHMPKDLYENFTNLPRKRFLLYDVNTPYTVYQQYTAGQFSAELIDFSPPVIRSVTAPKGSPDSPFVPGSVIPVTLEFSEPVVVADNACITVNGITTPLQDKRNGTFNADQTPQTSKYASFLYTVQNVDNVDTLVVSIPDRTRFTDLVGNTLALMPSDAGGYWDTSSIDWTGGTCSISGVNLTSFDWAAIESFSTDKNTYAYGDTVTVSLGSSVNNWLYDSMNNDSVLGGAYLAVRNPVTDDIDTHAFRATNESGTTITYTAQFAASEYAPYASKIQLALFYGEDVDMDNNGVFSNGKIAYDRLLTIELNAPKLASAIDLDTSRYPANNMIYIAGYMPIQLAAVITPPDADDTEIVWSSSDEGVATIIADGPDAGTISPASPGTVIFTATIYNFGVGDPVTAQTPIITVDGGGNPVIEMPKGADVFSARLGDPVTIRWVTNLNYAQTDFTITLYESGNQDGTVLYEGKLTSPSYTVPGGMIQKLSASGTNLALVPAYVIEISAPDPNSSHMGETLSTTGYITVFSQPASIKFNTSGDTYITDRTGSYTINWAMENLYPGTADSFVLTIFKNDELMQTVTNFNAGANSHTLSNLQVASGRLRDTYSIQAVAVNASGACVDVMLLYVYSNDALEILVSDAVGGAEAVQSGTLTLSNRNMIVDLYNSGGSAALVDFGRDINLQRYISINYGRYAWSLINDQIEWLSDNTAVATINYRQGTVYEPLSFFTFTKYSPATTFSLAGVGDGTSAVSATHARTGQTVSLDVEVETLHNRLYHFQFYPRQATKVSYTNGNGELRELVSDDAGALAVYEPSGINGNVSMQSGGGDMIYLGTIYNENLKSGEYNSANRGLYPVNIIQLRNTKLELYFSYENSAFAGTGNMTYSGAVYKNGELCPDSIIRDETKGFDYRLGKIEVNLDASKFWVNNSSEILGMSDNLVFEFIFQDTDAYYPVYIRTNGRMNTLDIVRVGANTAQFRRNAGNRPNPFVADQRVASPYLADETNVLDYDGYAGPGNRVPEETLTSTVLWWGCDPDAGYRMAFKNSQGASLRTQTNHTRRLPFFDAAITINEAMLRDDTIGAGTAFNLSAGDSTAVIIDAYEEGWGLRFSRYCTFILVNGVGLIEVTESPAVQEHDNTFNELLNSGSFLSSMVSGTKVNGVDKILDMLQTLTSSKILTLFDKVIPTADPYLYYMESSPSGMNGDMISSNPTLGILFVPFFNMEFNVHLRYELRYNRVNHDWDKKLVVGTVEFLVSAYAPQIMIPVPILITTLYIQIDAQLEFGGAMQWVTNSKLGYKYNNDQMSTFMASAGITATMGVGFDLIDDIIGVSAAVVGELLLRGVFPILYEYSPYDMEKYQAYLLDIVGKISAKASFSVLMVGYTVSVTLVELRVNLLNKGDYNEIRNWVRQYAVKDVYGIYELDRIAGAAFDLFAAGLDADAEALLLSMTDGYTVEETRSGWSAESRDYLSRGKSTWGAPSRLRSLSGITEIQSNANPFSNPLVSDDGVLMIYRSDGGSADINDTNISWAKDSGAGYVSNGAIDSGASALPAAGKFSFAGNSAFAVAAWEAQSKTIEFSDSGAPTDAEIDAMLSNSEIAAAVYNGSGWTTVRLTDNSQTDMSPVVATNGAGKAIALWRNMAGSGTADGELNMGDINNRVCYSVYNGGVWNEAGTLLANASGISGISAAMMDDGTTAVVYISDGDVYCMLVDGGGDIIRNVRLSADSINRNPLVTATRFGTEGERFLAAWYQGDDSGYANAVFTVLGGDGSVVEALSNGFNSAVESQGLRIGSDFRFAPNTSGNVDGLCILWSGNIPPADPEAAASSVLYGVRINRDNNGINFTVPQTVAEANEEEQHSYFCGWYDGASLNAVMLLKDWSEGYGNQGSRIARASTGFINSIEATALVDQEEIIHDFVTSFPFYITNTGCETLSSVAVTLSDGATAQAYSGLRLLPNQTAMLYLDYEVPAAKNSIKDLTYTVNATFSSGDVQTATGTLNIAIPNVGITSMATISAGDGLRTFRVSMQNLSNVEFHGNTAEYTAHLGIYTDPGYAIPAKNSDGNNMLYQFTGDDLELLDASALTKQITFALPATGFTDGDVQLFARAWAEEDGVEVSQYFMNGASSIIFSDPVAASGGNTIKTAVNMDNSSGVTEAAVTVTNLSFTPARDGNLAITLLGPGGEVLETQLHSRDASGLIYLGKEESKTFTFAFAEAGYSVQSSYYTVDPNGMNAEISSLQLSAIAIDFDKDTLDYNLSASNIGGTTLLATAMNPMAALSVIDASGQTVATGTGAVSYTLPLPTGSTTNIQVLVEPENRAASSKTYSLSIMSNAGNTEGIFISASGDTVTVMDNNSAGLVPNKWQYCLNGVWSAEYTWSLTRTFQPGTAYTSLFVRVFGVDGRYMDSNTLSSVASSSGGQWSNNGGGSSSGNPSGSFSGGNVYVKGSDTGIVFIINKDFSQFHTVLVSGTTLTRDRDYTAENSSTKITLLPTYLDTLAAGTHTMRVNFIDNTYATVTFTVAESVTSVTPVMHVNPFADVFGTDWFIDAVIYVNDRGLMTGTNTYPMLFSPNIPTTRGMVATILYRMEGSPDVIALANPFDDVDADKYYYYAVKWAAANGIVSGYGSGKFGPEDNITREQMATILHNYCKWSGIDVSVGGDTNILNFNDAFDVSQWAIPAFRWACGSGVISGKPGGLLDPKGNATRAEVATMLMRFLEMRC